MEPLSRLNKRVRFIPHLLQHALFIAACAGVCIALRSANRAITRESDYFCERYAGEMNKAKWSSRPRLNLFSRFPVYLHGQKPSVLLKTFLAFCCVGLMFSVVAPVIADENTAPLPSARETTTVTSEATATPTPSPELSEVLIPVDPAMATPSPSPSHSATTGNSSPESITASSSPSPTATPAAALKNQTMRVEIPSILPVDPRASSRNFPAILVSGPRYLLACVTGSNLTFDVYAKNAVQSTFNNEELVNGDGSSQLMITGTVDQVLAIFNSYGGLRASSTRNAIGGLYANVSLVAMNQPSLDPIFCGQRSPANFRFIQFRPLALGMNLIKNDVNLKK